MEPSEIGEKSTKEPAEMLADQLSILSLHQRIASDEGLSPRTVSDKIFWQACSPAISRSCSS